MFSVRMKQNGSKILIINLEDLSEINYIECNLLWKLDMKEKDIQMIHLTSIDLIETPMYKSWLERLPGKQIVCISDYGEGCDHGFVQMLKRGTGLFRVNPLMFPLPFTLDQDNLIYLTKTASKLNFD